MGKFLHAMNNQYHSVSSIVYLKMLVGLRSVLLALSSHFPPGTFTACKSFLHICTSLVSSSNPNIFLEGP